MPSDTVTLTSENAAEFYASRLPKRDEAPPAGENQPAEGKTETKNEPGESAESKEARVKKVAPRIAELVGERNAARTEAETKALEADAARLEAQELRDRLAEAERQIAAMNTPAQQKEADPRPQRAQFASDEAYTDALTDWKVDQRIAADKRKDAEARAAAAQQQVARNWQTQVEAGKEDMPDFDAVVGAAEVVFPQVVLDAVVDAGPRVAYQLAKDPEQARRIAAMRPSAAIAAVVKLGEQLAADGGKTAGSPAPAPTPAAKGEPFKAPEPIEHLKSGTSAVGKAEGEMTYEEWKAARKAGRIS
jgi:regulator of replication initiation timing